MKPVCSCCKHANHFYRTKRRDYKALKQAHCTMAKGRLIAVYRQFLSGQIKTSPRWCPLRKQKETT